ncbi:MAG: DUF4920 domain-containing protein [Chitinophagaceae bacterium]|nr:DUF4920 domain-containing protein [Chitinophagaceae bacterium]MCW5925885.1 DUF4920 domain-containing protein [Chitinophagaceae bacterium]
MKKQFILLAIVTLSAVFANAQPPEGKALPGDAYGAVVNAKGADPITTLPAKLDGDNPVAAKIKAKVLDVCPKKGCWLKLEINDSTTAFVKMKDYAFFLPTAIKGKTIVLDGEAVLKTTSVEELRHYAEDAKKSKEEIEAITKPKEEIRLTANGIVVVK